MNTFKSIFDTIFLFYKELCWVFITVLFFMIFIFGGEVHFKINFDSLHRLIEHLKK
jgi:hypothetical protein